ncbi:MAG: class I tRNA ligase family protein, partial [Candidatus Brocadiaceae bacterium]
MDHPKLPKRYDPPAVEPHWQQRWDEQRIYRFDPASDGPTFSIDTPPPTVSGALHIGHVFSYTHTDLAARFQRMRGRTVFYPMGWDDNGLPTERRVQSVLKVRCDPRLPYDPDFQPDPDAAETTPVSRRNFLELCARVTARDEEAFQHLWRRLGLSVDWTQTYATIDERSRRVAQMAFLDLVRKDEAYSADAPTMWDVDFQTAVAQAEVEDREILGHEYLLEFGIGGGGSLPIMTTRPELLGACVAVVVHPEDSRHRELVGRTAVTPGYRVRVPIYAHPGADPEKGTGAVMVCTFGDVTDVTWWEELDLPARIVLARDGRIISVPWGQDGWESLDPETARRFHGRIAGLSVAEAKRRMADLLAEPAAAAHAGSGPPLQGDPRPITQTTRFYEKGERPLEILLTRQWFIRLLDKREALREQGRKVKWHPESMRVRYERWVEGLKYDWCVSRQRYHGVPVPLWYSLDADGRPAHDQPLLPRTEQLPVEPMTETPPGLEETQRDRPGGFTAETDVLDTWATSSLTPQIVTGWGA